MCLVGCGGGCSGNKSPQRMTPATGATAAPTTAPTTFSSSEAGIELTVPAGWKRATNLTEPQKEPEYILVVEDGAGGMISLDYPDLPGYAFIIPMGQVVDGYLKDLRERFGSTKVEENADHTVGDAKARLVRTSWQSRGRSYTETALLMVHSRRVYILRGTSDSADAAKTRAAFEAVAGSIKWMARK